MLEKSCEELILTQEEKKEEFKGKKLVNMLHTKYLFSHERNIISEKNIYQFLYLCYSDFVSMSKYVFKKKIAVYLWAFFS